MLEKASRATKKFLKNLLTSKFGYDIIRLSKGRKTPQTRKDKTMKEYLFAIIILCWLFCGFMGIMYCKDDKTNWWMIVFSGMVVPIAFIAEFCGLL